jgi:transketolase N-terminal domain/subunit
MKAGQVACRNQLQANLDRSLNAHFKKKRGHAQVAVTVCLCKAGLLQEHAVLQAAQLSTELFAGAATLSS